MTLTTAARITRPRPPKAQKSWLNDPEVHLMLLVDFRSRVVVYWNWSWAFFTYGRGARLLTGDVHMQHTAATGDARNP